LFLRSGWRERFRRLAYVYQPNLTAIH